ncbi:MAG: outer membrane beta-barrel protein [Puia sp.]|nr:outer membrane beta-barrel protein [Puia sp.]
MRARIVTIIIGILIAFVQVRGADVADTLREPGVLHMMDTSAPRVVTLPSISLFSDPGGGSDQKAQLLEKNSAQLLSVTGSETMERAADLTVADAAQRIGGVSVIRGNSGEDSKAIIRGMSPKYVSILINGMLIPSPDDRNRDIPLDLFPAVMARRVEVYKSLTPDMDGSGIGGLVNVVMKEAGPVPALTGQFATGYSQLFFDRRFATFNRTDVQTKSPAERFGPDYYATGDDFSKNNLSFRQVQALPDLLGKIMFSRRLAAGRLGLVLAADYQAFHHGSDGFYVAAGAEPGLDNKPGLTDFYTRRYSTTTFRKSLYNQWDYRMNARNKLTLFSFYTYRLDAETRMSTDTSLDEGRTGPGTGRIDILQRSRLHIQRIYNSTLMGTHQLSVEWTLNWAAAFSYASGRYPDWSELDGETGRIQAGGGSVTQTPLLLGPLQRQWLANSEKQEEGKAGVSFVPAVFHRHLLFDGGFDLRHKTRDNFYTSYTFTPALTGNGMGQPFIDIYHAQWLNDNGPQNPLGSGTNPNTYNAYEQIGAWFLAVRYSRGRMDWVGGIRREQTLQDAVSSVNPALSYGQHIRISYGDWLPSLQGRYTLDEKSQLRFSYFKGLSRPALADITFFSVAEEDYNVDGNPFLIRTRADNLDFRYEYYSRTAGTWQIGVFYKHLIDPFEKTLLNAGDTLYPIPSNGLSYTPAGQLTEQLKNYGSARNYGLELLYTKGWGKWGLTGTYTFTISRITQVAKFQTRADPQNISSDEITVSRDETRPLEGQSGNLGSLSIWYKDPLRGTAQVSLVYTGSRINGVSGWYGLDQWQRGYAFLDLSVEKRLGRHISLIAKAANALNAAYVSEIRQPNPDPGNGFLPGQSGRNRIVVQRMQDGARYLMGVRFGY